MAQYWNPQPWHTRCKQIVRIVGLVLATSSSLASPLKVREVVKAAEHGDEVVDNEVLGRHIEIPAHDSSVRSDLLSYVDDVPMAMPAR